MNADGQQILSRVIIEIAGKPKEYIEKTIRLVIQKLKEEKNIKVEKERVFDAKEKNKMWSTFAELELQLNNVSTLIEFCFDYMPSSVEIIKPSNIYFDTNSLANILNDLLARLHHTDMVIKNLRAEKRIIEGNGTMLLKNAITTAVGEKRKDLSEISALIGVKEEQLKPFVDNLVKEGKIRLINGKYFIK